MTCIRKIATLIAIGSAAAVTACATPTPKPTVLVYGDSLTVLSESAIVAQDPAEHFVFRAVGGAGPCDFVNELATDRAAYHPTRVVFAFNGNVSNCSLAAWKSAKLTGVVANYESALRQYRSVFPTVPFTVIAPIAMDNTSPSYSGWYPILGFPQFGAMYAAEASKLGLTYSTAADDNLTPGHVFRWSGPAYHTGQFDVIRAADGVHLTPDGAQWYAAALRSR